MRHLRSPALVVPVGDDSCDVSALGLAARGAARRPSDPYTSTALEADFCSISCPVTSRPSDEDR